MEHRWNAREPYQCEVTLRCPRGGSIPGKTRDLSWGGMFIETAGLALPPNSFIEVTCHLGGDEPRRRLRMRGLVVHRAPDGAGVMFLETADEAVRALRAALLRKAESPRPAAAGTAVDGTASDAPTAIADRGGGEREPSVSRGEFLADLLPEGLLPHRLLPARSYRKYF